MRSGNRSAIKLLNRNILVKPKGGSMSDSSKVRAVVDLAAVIAQLPCKFQQAAANPGNHTDGILVVDFLEHAIGKANAVDMP